MWQYRFTCCCIKLKSYRICYAVLAEFIGTLLSIIVGDRLDDKLCKVRRDAQAFDRKGLQSIASDAVSCHSRDTHHIAHTPRPGASSSSSMPVRGILKKTPASINSVRLGE